MENYGNNRFVFPCISGNALTLRHSELDSESHITILKGGGNVRMCGCMEGKKQTDLFIANAIHGKVAKNK